MASIEQLPFCCGIEELGYIRDDNEPVDTLMGIDQIDSAHYVFSVTSREDKRHKKGYALARYIRDHKLGRVVSSPASTNPGHRGTLRAWIWTPNKRVYKTWRKKMVKKDPDKWGPAFSSNQRHNWW